jgi:hypothetical protein
MSDDSESADIRLANGRFAPGNRGGPGRPRIVDRVAELDQRAAEVGPDLLEALVATANAGNLKAMAMLLDRVWPARRGRPVRVEAPDIRKTADLAPAGEAVTRAVLGGELSPAEGAAAARVLLAQAKVVGTVDFETRLRALEDEDLG